MIAWVISIGLVAMGMVFCWLGLVAMGREFERESEKDKKDGNT